MLEESRAGAAPVAAVGAGPRGAGDPGLGRGHWDPSESPEQLARPGPETHGTRRAARSPHAKGGLKGAGSPHEWTRMAGPAHAARAAIRAQSPLPPEPEARRRRHGPVSRNKPQ